MMEQAWFYCNQRSCRIHCWYRSVLLDLALE